MKPQAQRRFYLILVLFALIGANLIYRYRNTINQGPHVGAYAPGFSLPDRDQKNISLNDLKGKAVLLNFWATWCGPCQSEMPSIEALYQRYRDKGFVVLAVSLDEGGWPDIKNFMKQIPLSFPIVNDSKQKVGDLYQTTGIPETYLIDTEGKITDKFVGPQNYDQEIFFKKVEGLLPKKNGS